MIYANAKVSNLGAIPEYIGKPPIVCATPTVNGFITPAENPKQAAITEIDSPTNASQPIA